MAVNLPLRGLARDVVAEWKRHPVSRMAAALAFFALFSVPGVLTVVLGIAGQFFESAAVRARTLAEVGRAMGPDVASSVGTIMEGATAQPSGDLFGRTTALVGLLLGATGAFLQLQGVLNEIWDVPKPRSRRRVLRLALKRVVCFAMVCGLGLLLVAWLLVSAGLSLAVRDLGAFSVPALRIGQAVASFATTGLVFAAIYKVLPDCPVRWREVWLGAAIVAGLLAAGQHTLGLYVGRAAKAAAFGQAGSLAVFVFACYVGCLVLLFGAVVTRTRARRRPTGR